MANVKNHIIFRDGQLVAVQTIESPIGQCADILRSIVESAPMAAKISEGEIKHPNGCLYHKTYAVRLNNRTYFASLINAGATITMPIWFRPDGKPSAYYMAAADLVAPTQVVVGTGLLFFSGAYTTRKVFGFREEGGKLFIHQANIPNMYSDDVMCFGDDDKNRAVDDIVDHLRSLRAIVATPYGTDIPTRKDVEQNGIDNEPYLPLYDQIPTEINRNLATKLLEACHGQT